MTTRIQLQLQQALLSDLLQTPCDGWHTLFDFFYCSPQVKPPPWPSFPARLFPTLCMCFLVHMWFYNLILRCRGFSWDVWKFCTCKSSNVVPVLVPALLGKSKADQVAPVSPDARPHKPSSRKIRNAPLIGGRSLALFLSAFCNLSGSVAPFELSSQKSFTQKLRKYRSFQGELQTNTLSQVDLDKLQLRLKSECDNMVNYAQTALGANVENMCSAIVDTGCSFTTVNSFKWVEPGSIRRLANPIQVGGIAGKLQIEFFGMSNMETLLPNGKVQPFPMPCLIHEQLPHVLVSPQVFLSQFLHGRSALSPEQYLERAESMSQIEYEQHFRVFHNRCEWHNDGHKLMDLKYDCSFLPRITLFRQGTALSTTQGLFSAFQSEAGQGAPPSHSSQQSEICLCYKKLLLLWHAKLGHISMARVLEFAMKGLLSTEARKLHPDLVGSDCSPLCGPCLCGKQKRKPDGTTITSKNPDTTGGLIKDKLVPGQCVFGDQLES